MGGDPLHIVGGWRESSSVPLEPSLNTHRSCSRFGFGPFGLGEPRGRKRRAVVGGGGRGGGGDLQDSVL